MNTLPKPANFNHRFPPFAILFSNRHYLNKGKHCMSMFMIVIHEHHLCQLITLINIKLIKFSIKALVNKIINKIGCSIRHDI